MIGSHERIIEIFRAIDEVAFELGRNFATYIIPVKEDNKTPLMSTTHAKINPEELIPKQHISPALRHLGFFYTSNEFLEIMEMIMDKYAPAWNLKTEHKAIYRTTMAMRLRCIMIKTGDSVKKKEPPMWVKQL